MSLTWREFKQIVESEGVESDDLINFIDYKSDIFDKVRVIRTRNLIGYEIEIVTEL